MDGSGQADTDRKGWDGAGGLGKLLGICCCTSFCAKALGPAQRHWGLNTEPFHPVTHSLTRFAIITFVTRGTILTLKWKKEASRNI